MPHPSWDNPEDFLDMDDFAVKAIIQFQDGGTRDIHGIYDGPYREGTLGEYQQDTTKPKFTCTEGVARGARRGDGLVVYQADGKTVFGTFGIMTYPQPDGTGLEILELSEE
ncbi:head-tail joining protein [Klebsiella pneumoniae]|uniref:head-tail joining protein n=1 Tax=Klebsiella pneumoniae TaxID=573 RepID=UPI001E38B82A|nr:hypothetical protein [Klebsiella pneumoniae]